MGDEEIIRIKIDKESAEEIMNSLPGGKEFYLKITDKFLEYYENSEKT